MVSKRALAIPLAVGAAGMSLYAYYVYNLRKKDEDAKDFQFTQDWTEHRMVLNKSYANLVIGQLEFISRSTNSKINIDRNFSNDDQMFSIYMRGTPESVHEAENLVNRLVESSPEITTTILEIPREKIKLFVGNFGDALLKISQETGSKLYLKCDPDFYEVSPFYVEIHGPREKTIQAYNLAKQTLGKDTNVASSTSKWDDFPKEKPIDIVNASQDSKYIEVVVSAILNMNQFWIQIYKLNSALDKMERGIADHFAHIDSLQSKLLVPEVGLMIAVPYIKQGKWHRAWITSVKEVETPERYTVKAMFIDYGDAEEVDSNEIRLLPDDFVRYPSFAVECSLHGVLPNSDNSNGKEEWSEESLDFFESLVSERSKIFMARKFGDYVVAQGKNGKKVIPSIDLVDTNASEDVYINEELVAKGYARWSHQIDKGDSVEKQITPKSHSND